MKTYNRKPKQIKAIQYDGSEEMAIELYKQELVTLEYDEGGFVGVLSRLKGETHRGVFVWEGYWIINEDGQDYCMNEFNFKEEYEGADVEN